MVLLLAVVDVLAGGYLLVHSLRRDRPALQRVAVAVLVLGALLAALHWLPPGGAQEPSSGSFMREV